MVESDTSTCPAAAPSAAAPSRSPTAVGASTQSFQPVTSRSRQSPIRLSSAAWASIATGPSEFPST